MRNGRLSIVVLSAVGLTALPSSTAWSQTPAPAPAPAPATAPAPTTAPSITATVSASASTSSSSSAPAPAAPSTYAVEFTSLRLMRDKGIISQAEYESAVRDLSETSGQHAPDEGTAVMGKWATTLYGFVEADQIYDTTRSFNDLAGSTLVQRPAANGGTNLGDNGRMQMGIRNSRVGFRLKAPEAACGIRASAMIELDFQGAELPIGVAQPYQGSEGTFSPTSRTPSRSRVCRARSMPVRRSFASARPSRRLR